MGVSDNFSAREPAGALSGTEVVALWKDGKNVKTTAQDIADLAVGSGGIVSATDSTTIDFTVTDDNLTGTYKFQPTTAGTVEANKAVVVDANKDAIGFRTVNATSFTGTSALLATFRNTESALSTSGVKTDVANFYQFYNDAASVNASISFNKGKLIVINRLDTGTDPHTLTLLGGATWDGTNTVATFGEVGDTIIGYTLDGGNVQIIVNKGVVLS